MLTLDFLNEKDENFFEVFDCKKDLHIKNKYIGGKDPNFIINCKELNLPLIEGSENYFLVDFCIDNFEKTQRFNVFIDTGNGFNSTESTSIQIFEGTDSFLTLKLLTKPKRIRLDPISHHSDFIIKKLSIYVGLADEIKKTIISIATRVDSKFSLFVNQNEFNEQNLQKISVEQATGIFYEYIKWSYKQKEILNNLTSTEVKEKDEKIDNVLFILEKEKNTLFQYQLDIINCLTIRNKKIIILDKKGNENNNFYEVGNIKSLFRILKEFPNNLVVFISASEEIKKNDLEFLINNININNLDIAYGNRKIQNLNESIFDLKPQWSPDRLLFENYFEDFYIFNSRIIPAILFSDNLNKLTHLDMKESLALIFILNINKKLKVQRLVEILSSGEDKKKRCYTKELTEAVLMLDSSFSTTNSENYNHLTFALKNQPLISIVIPTKNQFALTRSCVESLFKITKYSNYEVIIVNNQSNEEKIINWFKNINDIYPNRHIRVIDFNFEFNFSAINNFAVNKVSAEYICFLNNDTEIIKEDWLSKMISYAQISEIGAVGIKLLYDDATIQHAGIGIADPNRILHANLGLINNKSDKNFVFDRNVMAVTGACLVVNKSKFISVGGFDEKLFKIAYNDIDLCNKFNALNLRNVVVLSTEMIHHESKSRGYEITPEKKERYKQEYNSIIDKFEKINFSDLYLGNSFFVNDFYRKIYEKIITFKKEPKLSKNELFLDYDLLDDIENIVLLNSNAETKNLYLNSLIYNGISKYLTNTNKNINIFSATYSDLLSLCKKIKNFILIVIDGQRIMPSIISAAKSFSRVSILWCFDDPYVRNTTKKYERIFDFIFTNDKNSVNFYSTPAFYLPLGSDLYTKSEKINYEWDIFFCGSAWQNRPELIDFIIQKFPDSKFAINMPYKRGIKSKKLTSNLPLSSYIFGLSYEEYINIARKSLVTLNFSRRNNNELSVFGPGPRIFELSGNRAFQIVDNITDELAYFYALGLEIINFDSPDELVKKINFFLSNNSERESVIEKSFQRTLNDHTYDKRISTIFTAIKNYSLSNSKVALNLITRELKNKRNIYQVKRKKRLLYVVHNIIKSEVFGGLEIHQDVLSKNLSLDYDIFFLYTKYNKEADKRNLYLVDFNYNLISTFECDKTSYEKYYSDDAAENFFSGVLQTHNFDLIHFFSLINIPFTLPLIANYLGVAYVISIHDFFSICDSFTLLDYENNFCNITFTSRNKCKSCIKNRTGQTFGALEHRRSIISEVLMKASCLIYMSESTKNIMMDNFPVLNNINSRIHGAPLPLANVVSYRKSKAVEYKNGNRLKICIPGNFIKHKGSNLFVNFIEKVDKNFDIEFDIFGTTDEDVKSLLMSRQENQSNLKINFKGRYEIGGLPYYNYHYSLHLSIWPETYCQTLSEAWASRVVPICSNIGALGSRVTNDRNGLLFENNDTEGLLKIVNYIYKNYELHSRLKSNINDELFLNQSQHANLYDICYKNIFKQDKSYTYSYKANINYKDACQKVIRKQTWFDGNIKSADDILVLPDLNSFS